MSRIERKFCLISNSYLAGLFDIFIFCNCTNPIIHLFYPRKFCIIIVCNFSWDMEMFQEKSKTMPMQSFWGLKRCIIGFVLENYFTFDRIGRFLATFYQRAHFVTLIIRNLNLISVQSWTYLKLREDTPHPSFQVHLNLCSTFNLCF